MTGSRLTGGWRGLLVALLSVTGIVLAVRAERSGEARANRLHRDGQLEQAAELYGARAVDDTEDGRLRYNLGTTMLRLGSPDAPAQLAAAAASRDERVRVEALYNMGFSSLLQAMLTGPSDSIMVYAARAVEEYKQVLRTDPEHPDAPWNLSLAQRVLSNASPSMSQGNIDIPNDAPDLGEIQIVEGPQPFGEEEGFGDTNSEAEEEALADTDLEPLSIEQASEILGTSHLDPSTMLGKLMTREERARRGRSTYVEGPPW